MTDTYFFDHQLRAIDRQRVLDACDASIETWEGYAMNPGTFNQRTHQCALCILDDQLRGVDEYENGDLDMIRAAPCRACPLYVVQGHGCSHEASLYTRVLDTKLNDRTGEMFMEVANKICDARKWFEENHA